VSNILFIIDIYHKRKNRHHTKPSGISFSKRADAVSIDSIMKAVIEVLLV